MTALPVSTPSIVLVHGAWGGAWIWRRVLGPLRAAGAEVHAVTLTGDGERVHLRHSGISLATHVQDVVGLVEAEELTDVLLVGHSYGGIVITGAAEALRGSGRARVAGLVYVDAVVPAPGECWSSGHDAATQAARRATAAAHDHALPPADPATAFGLQGEDAAWLRRRQVPHPFGPYDDPLTFDPTAWAALPRTFVDCPNPALPTIDASRRRARAQPGWQWATIDTGHCPMVSTPDELVAVLLRAWRG